MATDLVQAHREWSHDELIDHNESQGTSVSQYLDHGSISFGKYQYESLSWEKRSVFSHNKCQEELDKFKAPGLVAQKKAYFEEYYKKIRELKGSKQDQQAQSRLDNDVPSNFCSQSVEEQNTSHVESSIEVDSDAALSEEEVVLDTVEPETKFTDGHQLQHLDKESTVSDINLSRSTISNERIEEIDQLENGCINLCSEMVSGKDDNLNRTIADIEHHENNGISSIEQGTVREARPIIAVESEANVKGTDIKKTTILKRGLGATKSLIDKKVELNAKKCKGQTSVDKSKLTVTGSLRRIVEVNLQAKAKASVSKNPLLKATENAKNLENDSNCKESNARPVRDDMKVKRQTKANVSISSQGIKHPLPRLSGKAKNLTKSSDLTIYKALGDQKASSTSSTLNRSLGEVHLKLNGPTSHSVVKQPTISASLSRTGQVSSKALKISLGLQVNPSNKSNIQNKKKETILKSMEGRTAESTRSSKLTARVKSNEIGGHEVGLHYGDIKWKLNEKKVETKTVSLTSKSVCLPPSNSSKTRNVKLDPDKKSVSSRSVDLTRSIIKSRQDKRIWR